MNIEQLLQQLNSNVLPFRRQVAHEASLLWSAHFDHDSSGLANDDDACPEATEPRYLVHASSRPQL